MKNIFLTSDFGAVKKINGAKVVCPADNTYGLISQIALVLGKGDFVFIASSPEDYEKNDLYAENVFKSLTMAGLSFNKKVVIDGQNAETAESAFASASLVFMAGGYPLSQIEFIKNFNLDKLLHNFNGVVLGQSAGAMNLAKRVYNYPEDLTEINDAKFWNGVGLSDITIIPHFDVESGNPGVEEIDLINDYFLPDSHNCTLYGVPNGSHVWIKNGISEFYGENYAIKNGVVSVLKKTNELEK